MKSYEIREEKQGIPPPVDKRLKCLQCGKTLRVRLTKQLDTERITNMLEYIKIKHEKGRGKTVSWKYQSEGHFCSFKCATRFANIIVDTGK